MAAQQALSNAGRSKEEIDAIVFATMTPNFFFPGNGPVMQAKMGFPETIPTFDIRQQCSGFLYGMNVARCLIASGSAKHVLVVGAETLSRIVDYGDLDRTDLLPCLGQQKRLGVVVTEQERGSGFFAPDQTRDRGGERRAVTRNAERDPARSRRRRNVALPPSLGWIVQPALFETPPGYGQPPARDEGSGRGGDAAALRAQAEELRKANRMSEAAMRPRTFSRFNAVNATTIKVRGNSVATIRLNPEKPAPRPE